MSDYKTELQSNNVDLQNVLETVKALPEAGASAPAIDCRVTVNVQTMAAGTRYRLNTSWYAIIKPDLTTEFKHISDSMTSTTDYGQTNEYVVPAGSLLVVSYFAEMMAVLKGEVESICLFGTKGELIKINGDCSVYI